MSAMHRNLPALVVAMVALATSPTSARAQSTDALALISLDSLLNTRISAASKYAQRADDAAASVTILTAEDIARSGFTRFGEVIESVRGFYMSDSRADNYLGTRGFGRPTDYNNRVLLLVDGHTMNEQTWGSASVGDDLPINLAAIERIEIVRGPGSAVHGTSAMFAVINVVTKSGADLAGVRTDARLGISGERQLGVAAGHVFRSGSSVALSGSLIRSDGEDLYYAEYDDPATNSGVAERRDWGRAGSVMATVQHGSFTGRAGFIDRRNGEPTGAYGSLFNDPRSLRHDATTWGEATVTRGFGGSFQASARLFADRYHVTAKLPFAANAVFSATGESSSAGAELLGVWESSSRNRVSVGAGYRDVSRSEFVETLPDGTILGDDAPFRVRSIFAQDELQLSQRLRLVGGWRLEQTTGRRTAGAPRLALIITPDAATTIKALYGEAFRVPSAAEAEISTSSYRENPALRAERIQTTELAVSRRLGQRMLAGASVYSYRMRDLIEQVLADGGTTLEFRNVARSKGTGVEFDLDVRPTDGWLLRGSYALQNATGDPDGINLTNSPTQVATAAMTHRGGWFTPTLAVRYESGRRTLDGTSTTAFLRTDANVSSSRSFLGANLGLRISNLFNTRYATPGGLEHRQRTIDQPGRRVSLTASWHHF